MKKLITITAVFIISLNLNAQELGYGVSYGAHIKDNKIETTFSAGATFGFVDIGGFFDYQINSSTGIRFNLIYSKYSEDNFRFKESGTIIGDTNISALQIRPSFKFDVNSEYNKGFYLQAGPRLSLILGAKLNDIDAKEIYRNSQIGFQFGFGTSFSEHFAFDVIGDIGLDFIDQNVKSRTYGAYFSFSVNLESIINN